MKKAEDGGGALAGRRVLLGVTGGIASYKSVWVARLLTQAEAQVDVVMSRAASEFVGAITFEAVTGRTVWTHLLAAGHALDHIRLARAADAVVVAPATADFLAKAAHGLADDLLTATLLATSARVLLVPAMNDRMWAHQQTSSNVARARELGYTVLDPDAGPLAAGEGSGPGRMPEPERIVAHVRRMLRARGGGAVAGKRVLVTAGATREPVDPVRFISNHSSGRMGVAVAAAAWERGADVTLIAGSLEIAPPGDVRVIRVETTSEMSAAVESELPAADVLVMAAAPSDFRASVPAESKIKRAGAGTATIALTATRDILADTMHLRRPGTVVVGFALETDDLVANAREKRERKQLDLIVANSAIESDAGFGVDTNRVTLIGRDGREEAWPVMAKSAVAERLLDHIERLLDGR